MPKPKPKPKQSVASSLAVFINSNKMFAATCMLMLNIGSRYVNLGITKSQEHYIRKLLSPELFVFIVFWMGSRDIFYAFILASIYSLLSRFLLNENSRFCVMKKKMKSVVDAIDTNNDGKISEAEIDAAVKALKTLNKGAAEVKVR